MKKILNILFLMNILNAETISVTFLKYQNVDKNEAPIIFTDLMAYADIKYGTEYIYKANKDGEECIYRTSSNNTQRYIINKCKEDVEIYNKKDRENVLFNPDNYFEAYFFLGGKKRTGFTVVSNTNENNEIFYCLAEKCLSKKDLLKKIKNREKENYYPQTPEENYSKKYPELPNPKGEYK